MVGLPPETQDAGVRLVIGISAREDVGSLAPFSFDRPKTGKR
jgi:hypothetical protein